MIKQTRGAIRFLLADYRAVLKYAMIAAAGIALASPSFAKITINGNEGQQTTYSDDKDFGDSVVVNTKLTLEDGDYTADSVDVTDGSYGEGIKYELVVRNATLTTSKNGGRPNPGSGVLDPIFVQGKLSLTNATVTSRDNGEQADLQFWGSGTEAAFAGDVTINAHLGFGRHESDTNFNIVLDGKDTNGTITGLNLTVNDELGIHGGSLTIKGYKQGEDGAAKDTFTYVKANEVCIHQEDLGHDSTLTIGHNGTLETSDLRIGYDPAIKIQKGTVTVTNGGKLIVTGNRNNGSGFNGVIGVWNENKDKEQVSEDRTGFEGIFKAEKSSNIVITHQAAVLYDPVKITDEDGENLNYVPNQAFDIDNSSKLTISDLGAMTKAEVKALKEKLLYNGTGTLDGYTWDESEKITGDISIDDALDPDYEGTTLLKDNVITGVKDEVTGGPHTWGSAVLDASASSLSVGADTSLSLAGAANNGGKFVTNDDGSVADEDLAAKSTLTLEGNGTVGDVKGGAGTLTTENGSVTAGKIDVDNISMQSGTLNAESVTLKDAEGKNSNVNGSTINVAKDMNVKDITLKGSALNIGGSLNVSGKLVADPTYVYADGGITLTGTGELNVLKDTVMINGTQAQGVTPSSSANLVLNKKLDLAGTTAAHKVTLNGDIENNELGTLTPTLTKEVTVGPNANLIITGAAFADAGTNAVLNTDSYEVKDGGQITLANIKAAKDSTFKIFDTSTTSDLSSDQLKVANALYGTTFDKATGEAKLAVKADAASVLSGVSGTTRDAILARANSADTNANYFDASEASGLGVVSAALESSDVARALNSFTGTVFAAYAPQNALLSSRAGAEAVEQRNGFRAQAGMGNVRGQSAAVWVTPLYKRSTSDSFDIEGSKYGAESNLYGLALGSDFAVADGWRLGADFNVGKGDSKSRGDVDYTKNDFKFFGFGLYGSYSYEKLNVLTDIGYTKVDNDVEQSGVKSFDSDFDSQVFTVGINAKYEFNTSVLDIAPHFGVRYFRTKIDSYSVKNNGAEYLHGDSLTGNLVEFPLGVSLSRSFKTDGWTLKPVLDLSVIPTAGDRDLTAKTQVNGLSELSTTADIVDAVSFNGTLGLDVRNNDGTLGMGIGYGFTGSKNEKAHNVTATFRYSF